MLKSAILAIFIFLYTLFCIQYPGKKILIKEIIEKAHPSYYSRYNQKVSTVFFPINYADVHPIDPEVDPISNGDYHYKPKKFSLDDTDELENYGLACQPKTFGYSKSRGNKVFPPYTYPKCSEKLGTNDSYLIIDREKQELKMNCPKSSQGAFVYGPRSKYSLVQMEDVYDYWDGNIYKGPVNSTKIDFGLGTCGERCYSQGYLTPIFNQEAYKRAKTKKSSNQKPRLIYFLTIDSVSRRHFFRKIPKVVDFFNNLNETHPDFAVYDFKLHNILAVTSADNQVPIFGGFKNYVKSFPGDQFIDYLGEDAIWNMIKDKGYISMLGLEDCDHYFSVSLGRNPKVDYSVRQFYCAVQAIGCLSFEISNAKNQRCIGPYQSHYYILNYTHNLVSQNQGVNQWLYVHLNTAHEGSGEHAATLNDDLLYFIKKFIDDYSKDNEIIIFLQADHGMNYGFWYGDLEGYQEKKLPSLFIIASKSVIESYKFGYFSLESNTYRLTSKLDLRETMLSLAGIEERTLNSVNLFNSIAPKRRTCMDTRTVEWECACSDLIEIENFSSSLLFLLSRLKSYTERVINSKSYSAPNHPLNLICKYIHLTKIQKVFYSNINNVNEFIRFQVISPAVEDMEFEVDVYLSADHTRMESDSRQYPVENMFIGKHQIQARVVFI